MSIDYIDEAEAFDYLGKVVLLGITYLDHNEQLIGQKQWVGTIATFSKSEGIKIKLRDSDEPCGLPPDRRGIRKAPPGSYRLRSTGEVIENPDFLATWTCVQPAPNSSHPGQVSGPTSGRRPPSGFDWESDEAQH